MTSTSFNVGLNDGRNSSRVLKPPGGGHTDIFGSKDENSLPIRAQPPKSQITECFGNEVEVKKPEIKNQNGTEEVKTDNDNNVEIAPAGPQRIRVPPGGFSSGLW